MYDCNYSRIRRQLLIRVVRDYMNGKLSESIDSIPVEMRPRNEEPMRCCVYKDRAVLKYRLMALLGFGVEDEVDEAKSLASYLIDADKRKKLDDNVLSVVDVACHGCVDSQYLVTNACRGCFARPCVFSCPKQAIKVTNGQAKIDHTKCIDCGKCTQVCPYHAIVRVSIPCQEACPVDAINKSADGKQKIDFDKCISCGKCMTNCPFGAVMERSQIIDVLKNIKGGKKVAALVAPSIIGQFPGKLEQIAEALKMAGFALMEEVACGAEETTAHESKEFFERMREGAKLMTSSCCPAYVEAVKRHVPELLPMVSDTPSPMKFSGLAVKSIDPEYVTVFVGPCVAKRKEALNDENIDYVLTFEELGAIFAALNINVACLNGIELEREAKWYGRGFATSCGVTEAILHESAAKDPNSEESKITVNHKFINGLDRKSMKMLKLYAAGKLPGNFLEVMACEGGCVGGPCVLGDVKIATKAVKDLAGE